MIPKQYDLSNKELFKFNNQPAFRLIHQSLSKKNSRKKLEQQLDTVQKVITEGEYIDKHTCDQLYQFNVRLEPTKITTLHLAVMTGQYQTAKKLLSIMKVDPNSVDWRGWTPLHHAIVLQNARMINLLIKFGALGDQPNNLNATPLDFYHMINANKIPLENKIYQVTDDREFTEITREKFKEVTGATYVDWMMVKPETLLNSWTKEPSFTLKGKQYLYYLKQYYDPKRDIQTLALQIEGRDGTGKKVPIGPSVVAYRDIKAGELICEFIGHFSPLSKTRTNEIDNYRLGQVTGQSVRNLGSMIPDGFPNTVAATVKHVKGLAERHFILAIKDIKKGQPVTMNLCNTNQKFARYGESETEKVSLSNRYIEIQPSSLENFLLNNSITEILLRDRIAPNDLFSITYVLDTPLAFMKHILKGTIPQEDLTLLLDPKFFKKTNLDRDILFYKIPEGFHVKLLNTIMENPDRYIFIRNFLLLFLEKGYLPLISGILMSINSSGIEIFQDVDLHPLEDFSQYTDLALRFLDEGKGDLALLLIFDLLQFFKIDK